MWLEDDLFNMYWEIVNDNSLRAQARLTFSKETLRWSRCSVKFLKTLMSTNEDPQFAYCDNDQSQEGQWREPFWFCLVAMLWKVNFVFSCGLLVKRSCFPWEIGHRFAIAIPALQVDCLDYGAGPDC